MRVAVLSDIHANLGALEAVLAAIPPVDALWHLGDVVGYGPDPDAVVERLAGLGAVGVRGNHDAAALGGREAEAFNPDARRAIEWTGSVISGATRTWLGALPEQLDIEGCTLVHGSPRDPTWEYITGPATAAASLRVLETPLCLHGHTHVPMAWIEVDGGVVPTTPGTGTTLDVAEARALLNPGSVGQPRDGIPAASWMLLDTDLRAATWHRTAYAVRDVQARMLAAGLPERLVARLAIGA